MNTIVYVGETPWLFEEEQPGRDTWELLYCTSGEGTVSFDDGQVLHFGKDALVVLPPKGQYRYSDGDAYTGIYLCIEEPSFPEAAAFKTTDDESLLYHAVGKQSISLRQAEKRTGSVLVGRIDRQFPADAQERCELPGDGGDDPVHDPGELYQSELFTE